MRFFSRAYGLVGQAVAELWRRKLRSCLTMFGIGWGVAALALIFSSGEGFRQGQRKNWAQLGDSIVLVFGGIWGFWGIFFAIPLATLVKAIINAWPKKQAADGDDTPEVPEPAESANP